MEDIAFLYRCPFMKQIQCINTCKDALDFNYAFFFEGTFKWQN